MEFLVSFLNVLLPLLYFISTYLYGIYFFRNDPLGEKYMIPALRITVLIHLVEIVLRGIYFDHFPLASIYEALSVLAFAIVIIYIFVENQLRVQTTGYFILALVFFLQLFSSAFISFVTEIPEILNSPFFILHTSAAILGYSGLTVSAVYGLLYLLLFYDIKSSRFGVIYSRLPSLEILNEMNFRAALVGFFFLTIAIILGFIWSKKVFGQYFHLDPKIIVAIITWFVYGIEIIGKRKLDWAGKRLAYISLSGFVIIVFSMIAVNLYLTTFHEFK